MFKHVYEQLLVSSRSTDDDYSGWNSFLVLGKCGGKSLETFATTIIMAHFVFQQIQKTLVREFLYLLYTFFY